MTRNIFKELDALSNKIDEIDRVLEIKKGYQPVKTIKELSKGAISGTVDLFSEMSSIKFELEKKIEEIEKEIKKIKDKINEISEVINND